MSKRPTDPYELAELILDENPGLADAAGEAGQTEEDAALELAFVELANRKQDGHGDDDPYNAEAES